MTYHKLYIAFDVNGEPFAVSPDKASFAYHDPERIREFVSKEVVDCFVNSKIDLMVKVDELKDCIRDLLKGGEHEGECDNDQGMMNEGGASQQHCEASKLRELAAQKLLEEK